MRKTPFFYEIKFSRIELKKISVMKAELKNKILKNWTKTTEFGEVDFLKIKLQQINLQKIE